MNQRDNFYNINQLDKGIQRQLGVGLKTSIFCGEQAMISIVEIEPNSEGKIHSHPQEQWGFLIEVLELESREMKKLKLKKVTFG